MKRFLFLVLLVALSSSMFAQVHRTCFSPEVTARLRAQNPTYDNQMRMTEDALRKFVATGQRDPYYSSRAVRTIPVVFHVVYNNSVAGTNVSTALIQQTLNQMNLDYSKTNTDLSSARQAVQSLATDAQIQFCLAQRDPNGAATTGIDRVATTKVEWDANTESDDMKSAATGGANIWDSRYYMNIWIVAIAGSSPQTGGIAGYSYIPATGNGLHGSSIDGIVVDYSIGLGTGNRTLTHETGHYLGLHHTWGDNASNACGNVFPATDDGFSDTPDSKAPNYFCTVQSSCSGMPAYGDLFEDFMDYGEGCAVLFTPQQVNWMNSVLTNIRSSLFTTQVCSSTGAPSASFTGTPTSICTGQTVTFSNTSTGNNNTYNWTFAGGTPGTSTATNPTVTYNTAGTYTVTLVATNSNGTNTSTRTAYITVAGATALALPLAEGFESATFPPTNWTLNNADASTTWVRTTSASGFGTSTACAYMNNYSYNAAGQKDWLITPAYNFSGVSNGRIRFEYAYAPYNVAGSEDSLEVLYSTNCGGTWNSLWKKGGSQLATATAISSSFIPGAGQWKRDSVSLSALNGQTSVRFAFKNACQYGNNIFLDNVNIYNATAQAAAPVADFIGTPTTVVVGNTVAFTDLSTNSPNSWSWSFTGGTPSTSTAQNPTITYNTVGVYPVSLTASNGNGNNTATKTSYITVIAAGGTQTCDTLANTTAQDTITLYTVPNVGYLSGNNTYGDLAKAEFYTNTQSVQVNGAFYRFGRAVVSSAGTIQACVWDASGAGGTPGATPVSSTTVNISTIIADIANNYAYTYVSFASPPTITGNYYVGFILPTGTGDSVAIFTTTYNSPSVGQGWEQWNDATWHNYTDYWSQAIAGFEVSNIIYPVTCTTSAGSAPVASFTASNTAVCVGTTINFTSTTTGNPTGYSWTFGGGTPSGSSLQNPSVVYNTAGTYTATLTASNANGSNTSSPTTITVYANPTLATSSIGVLCYGGSTGSATVTPSGGSPNYTYSWSGGGSTATISNKVSGTYSVTVSDSHACSATTSVNISQPLAALSATASSTNAACNQANGSALVSATGGTGNYTYLWNNSANTATAANLNPGVYTVTVTDGNGCTATATTTVGTAVSNFAVTISSTNATCGLNNGTATALPNNPTNVTYQWSNSSTNASLSGLGAGTYTVTATNPAGCTASASAVITSAPSNISVTFSTTLAACGQSNGGATATVTGGSSPYTYLWSTNSTTNSISNVAAGSYPLTVTDNAGCSVVNSASISNSGGPTVTANSTAPTCNGGANGSATATATGGSAPYTYTWSNNATGATANGLAAGSYSVTVRDATQCIAVQSVTVSNPAAINASVTTTNALCGQQNGSAVASATGGTGSYTYFWSNASTIANNIDLGGGTYTVTITDGNGCTAVATGSVSAIGGPTSSLNAINGTCQISPQISTTVSGGTAPFTFVWSNGATTQNLTGMSAGSYTITITDANGCKSISTASVTDNSSVNVTFNSQNPTQGNADGSITANPTGGTQPYTYNWSNGSTNAQVSGLVAGTYTVTITDNTGCIKVASVTLSSTVGVAQVTDVALIKLYPNPTKDVCNIYMELNRAQNVEVKIVNSIGQQVYATQENNFKQGIVPVDVSTLAASVYTVHIYVNGSIETLRFVKQ
jgi:PKD repeat protein